MLGGGKGQKEERTCGSQGLDPALQLPFWDELLDSQGGAGGRGFVHLFIFCFPNTHMDQVLEYVKQIKQLHQ